MGYLPEGGFMEMNLPTEEGFIPFRGYKTWYRIVGDREGPCKIPLLCLHGGPGATHDYFGSLEAFASTGRRVILYDQLGWGQSDHIQNPAMWKVELYVEELGVICQALGLDHVHILGHSWGGQLAMEYALTQPSGLASLILADTLISASEWANEARRLISELPEDVQQTIIKHEAAGTTDSPEYKEAMKAFSRRHGGGHIDPKPEWVKEAFKKLEDNEIYITMWGPSEFCVTGTLKDWDITNRLVEIRVPTLVLCGRYDEATPVLAETIHHDIPGSELVIFEHSAHFPHIEEPEKYLQVLGQFLDRVEEQI
jgi:proline-specific peptidase